jgi:outer membrane protein TolC
MRTARLILCVSLVSFVASAASAQTTEANTPISQARLSELMAAAIQSARPATSETSYDLGIDEAVRLALEHNLDIAVERLNPQTFDFAVAAARAAYRPTLTSTVGDSSAVTLPTSQLVGGQRVENQSFTYNAGVAQALPWGGGSFAVAWNNRRLDSSNQFTLFNPQYNSTFTAAFVQPLLRGLRTDITRTLIRVTSLNRDISEIQLRATLTNTLASVKNGYWDLVYAIQAVDVAKQSLALAEKLIEDNKVRVEVGTLAPIDIVQAEAEAATRRQTLAQAEATWLTAELALKRLIVGGTDDPLWRARINPVDRPTYESQSVDMEGAVRRALEKRTDLAETKRTLEINDASVRLLRNQTLPAADLVGSYGLQGVGGTQFIRGSGLGSPILETIPGGFGDALSALTRRDFPSWNVQLQISYPIGQSSAEANYARAKLQVQQTQAQLRALELQVATEVTNAGLQVESNKKQLEAATAARALARKRLEAETSKFEVGMSTNFFVVQAQRDLSDAANAELRALADYRKSLVDFERVQEASLSNAGISVVSSGGSTNAPRASVGGGTGGGGTGGGNQ